MPTETVTIFIALIVVFVALYIGFVVGKKIQKLKSEKEHEEKIPDIRKDAISKSRSVLSGQFSEQLAPYLPDFNYKPTEVRFLGKPIDFVVFKGMDNKKIDEVVFVEVKSGKAKINNSEKSLQDVIEKKKVRWEEYRIPEEVTRRKE